MDRENPTQTEYGTYPQASRRFNIGVRRLRAKGRDGCFPVYGGAGSWPLLKFSEVERWLRSTRVAPTDHATKRVDEILKREGSS